jgi:DNA-binding CsgD family transcriptional regulator
VLIGRESECERLEGLLDRARLGRSAALVVRGEPGIGKTALLDHAAERAAGMTVVRALGVESEAELEFSALLDICRPCLEHVPELPERHAAALQTALGLGPAAELDRFAIGAATLGLLAAAAESNPLLVIVDDAQWLDRSSADALLFAARRLEADRALVLFAARAGEERTFDAPGLDSLTLSGLGREAAARLIRRQVDVTPDVANRLHDATNGNPLALIELPSVLSPDQLTGPTTLDEPLPTGAAVARAFARRADSLPEQARQALLVAAASTTASSDVVLGALGSLGLAVSALEPAEDAELLRLAAGRIEFRHPLVRSAVYQAAAPSERRAVHRALAAACGETQPEECAWHLAAAALGPDEEVAAALERAAGVARRRSGYAAAAAALERAARLSPDAEAATGRLADAAEAAWRAGRVETAGNLTAETLARGGDASLRARALRLKGAIDYVGGRADAAADALLRAVELLESSDPRAAVAAGADAVNALVRVDRPELALETAQKARALAARDGAETDSEATLVLGFALWIAGRPEDAQPHLQHGIELFGASTATPGPLQVARLASAHDWLGRYEDGRAYFAQAVARARAAGSAGSLPSLLAVASWQALHAGRWNEANADAGEALELADALGQPVAAAQALGVLTWVHALQGDEARCRAYGEETQRRARAFGLTLYEHLVALCLALLDLGAGRANDAIGPLEQLGYGDTRMYVPGAAGRFELAEAYVRTSRVTEAEGVLRAFEASPATSVPLLAATAKRCRGLLAEVDRFEPHFVEALALHAGIQCPFALARTQLCYGERLRRAGSRVSAREQLRAALETFERLGAARWAERARSELRASGETLRRREVFEDEQLTPQELQIALQVAEGKTNKEVGAALFLSHKTIEFHLSRIYRKLDMHSRAELIRRFASGAAPAVATASPGVTS